MTEEKFKVVRQEAITAYDAHSTSVIEKPETPVVAVAPAITEVEAVAKPKSQKRSKKSHGDKSLSKQKHNKKTVSEVPANEPALAQKDNMQKEAQNVEDTTVPEVIILEDKSLSASHVNVEAEKEQTPTELASEMPVVENPKKGWWNKAQE